MVSVASPRRQSLREIEAERYILSTRPSLWLPFYRKDGNVFHSADAYGHLCTVSGALWSANGRVFAGAEYINCGNNSILDFTSGDFSISCWIKPTTLSGGHYILSRGLINVDGYFLFINPASLLFFYTNQADASQNTSTTAALVVDTWYHLGVVRSGANVTLYQNAVIPAQTSGTHINPLTSTKNMLLGVKNDLVTQELIGTLDSLAIYSRALSQPELQHNYNATRFRYGV